MAVPCMVWTWFVVLVGVVSDLTRFLTLVCVECLIGKQKKARAEFHTVQNSSVALQTSVIKRAFLFKVTKPILFKVTKPLL